MESSSSITSPSQSDIFIKTLINKGWCFSDIDKVQALIQIQLALHGDSCTLNSIESELYNMDLRSIGAKSLPDASLLRANKSFTLQGPKLLQALLLFTLSYSYLFVPILLSHFCLSQNQSHFFVSFLLIYA